MMKIVIDGTEYEEVESDSECNDCVACNDGSLCLALPTCFGDERADGKMVIFVRNETI